MVFTKNTDSFENFSILAIFAGCCGMILVLTILFGGISMLIIGILGLTGQMDISMTASIVLTTLGGLFVLSLLLKRGKKSRDPESFNRSYYSSGFSGPKDQTDIFNMKKNSDFFNKGIFNKHSL